MSAEDHSQILFERQGSWRTWPYVLFAVIFGIAGVCCLVGTVRPILTDGFELVYLGGYVLAIFFISLFLGIALLLSYRMVFSPTWSTRIDGKGISMSQWHVPWSDVKEIYTKASRSFAGTETVSLNFHRRSGVPLDYGIQGFEFLASEEADEILDALGAYLEKTHSDIDIEE